MCFGGGGGEDPQILADKPKSVVPEQEKPEVAEIDSEENRKKKGRSALRIDLNPGMNTQTATSTASSGTGLNVG